MLKRAIRSGLLIRAFSGNDPHWLHLHETPDPYPQYQHLHWHTFDLLEIGKYAKLRSKAQFGSHVSEDPASIEWFPEVGDLKYLDKDSRDTVYEIYARYEDTFTPFLEETLDYHEDGNHKLIESASQVALSVLKPKQINDAEKFAQGLIEEYKAAGVGVTRDAVEEKVKMFLLKKLSKHQAHDLEHGMFMYLEYFGLGLPLNED